MGLYGDHVLPRIINVACGMKSNEERRARVCAGLHGEVVEIGFGSGLNVPFYPETVDRVAAVEPADLGWKLAAKRVAASSVAIERAGLDGQRLPFDDDSFDLVFGHAILHHIPDLDAAFSEFRRVLRPGGRIAFCGEPSHHGDRLAALPKRMAMAVSPYWRRMLGVGRRVDAWDDAEAVEHGLEHVVDVHAFTPSQLEGFASRAGFGSVRVSGEELVAGWFGWANRTLESTAEARQIPSLWFQYAYRGYMALKALDDHVLEPALPPAIFYNLPVSAEVPLSDELADRAPRAATVAAAR